MRILIGGQTTELTICLQNCSVCYKFLWPILNGRTSFLSIVILAIGHIKLDGDSGGLIVSICTLSPIASRSDAEKRLINLQFFLEIVNVLQHNCGIILKSSIWIVDLSL